MSFSEEYDNLRSEPKLQVQDRDEETLVTSIDISPDISIRHTPPIRGGLAELQKKGLKITDYHTTVQQQ